MSADRQPRPRARRRGIQVHRAERSPIAALVAIGPTAQRLALIAELAPQIARAWQGRPAGDLAIVVAHPNDPIGAQIIAAAPRPGRGPMVGVVGREELAGALVDVAPEQVRALAAASAGEPWIVVVAFWGTTAGPVGSFDVDLAGGALVAEVLH